MENKAHIAKGTNNQRATKAENASNARRKQGRRHGLKVVAGG